MDYLLFSCRDVSNDDALAKCLKNDYIPSIRIAEMDIAVNYMDFSTMPRWRIYKEERFRTPLSSERQIGLWVDRIGSGVDRGVRQVLRVLGQYAVVHVDAGDGHFHSPTTGTVRVQSHQAMILFPDEPNTYYADSQWTTRWVVWNGPDAATLEKLGYLSRDHAVVTDHAESVARAFSRLSRIIHSEDITAVLERKTIVQEMLLDLFRHSRQSAQSRRCDDLMERAVQFLTSRFAEEIPIEQLAQRFNLSCPHFRRLFKAYTGRSPKEFTISLRISRAKELLSQGLAIKEVADQIGYDDIFYFMRLFKKTTGISPGKFSFIAS